MTIAPNTTAGPPGVADAHADTDSPSRASSSDVGGANGTPAVDAQEVLAGLGAGCVPAFCDRLRFDLVSDGATITASFPPASDDSPASGDADRQDEEIAVADLVLSAGRIVIAVRSESLADEPMIDGTITCTWHDPERPTEADHVVARLIADQALTNIRLENLAAALHHHRTRAANLEQALATNREIGQAIGILMASDHVTAEQAFAKLRIASQHSHRKLRAIAADVTETGALLESAAASPRQ